MKRVFRKLTLFFLVLGLINSFNVIGAINDVRIFEIYSGGGNSGATYDDDFIILFNSTTSPIDLNGWSLQYASGNSSTWTKLDINSLSIPGRGFILINVKTTTTVGIDLPIASIDWTFDNDGMAQAGGKVALMQNQTLITTAAPLGAADFVGYGTATSSETSPASSTGISSARSYVRKNYDIDTNNNSADFRVATAAEFSGNIPYTSSGPFPVKLSKFSAQVSSGSNVTLNWQTTSETSFSHFEIQRSADALGFETIGKEFSKGNNVDQNIYDFLDEKPLQGQNYYRLKQVDINGSVEFSKIIAIQINEISAIVFYPNPVVDVLEISGAGINQVEKIRIFNSTGKEIENLTPINNSINIRNLDTQILFIEAKLKDGSIYKKRIVKQ